MSLILTLVLTREGASPSLIKLWSQGLRCLDRSDLIGGTSPIGSSHGPKRELLRKSEGPRVLIAFGHQSG